MVLFAGVSSGTISSVDGGNAPVCSNFDWFSFIGSTYSLAFLVSATVSFVCWPTGNELLIGTNFDEYSGAL